MFLHYIRISVATAATPRPSDPRDPRPSAHESLFDLETGEFLRQTTHQGFRGDSCWSRGLAWAIYGFGTAYAYARDPLLLATAEACADFYICHTPDDGVPPWDYDAPAGSP